MDSVPDGMKKCGKCLGAKPATLEFFTSNGVGKLKAVCKACKKKPPRHPPIPDGERWCALCKKSYPATFEYFSKHKGSKLGLAARCRECSKRVTLEWREQNPERASKAGMRWHANNRQSANLQRRERRLLNLGREKATQKVYREKNQLSIRVANRNYKARKKQAEGSFTALEWQAKLELYKGRCHWCSKKIKGTPHADHLIPITRGGSNYISNIVPSCSFCNVSKHNKLPHEWIGRLL